MKYLFLTLCSLSFVSHAIEYDKEKVRASADNLVDSIDTYYSRDLGDWFQKQNDMGEVQRLARNFERCADKYWNADQYSCMQNVKREAYEFENKLDRFKRNSKINFKLYDFLHTLRAQADGVSDFEVRHCADNVIEAITNCKARNIRDINQQQKDISEIRFLVHSFERCQNKTWNSDKSFCMDSLRRDINDFEKRLDRFNHNPRIGDKLRHFIYIMKLQSL